jgi:hypothetical protein
MFIFKGYRIIFFLHEKQWVMKFANNTMYMCVDVVEHFAMNLVTIILDNKSTYLQTIQFFQLCPFNTYICF